MPAIIQEKSSPGSRKFSSRLTMPVPGCVPPMTGVGSTWQRRPALGDIAVLVTASFVEVVTTYSDEYVVESCRRTHSKIIGEIQAGKQAWVDVNAPVTP